MIIVSTDGSCLRNPGGAIGWAWVNHQGTSGSGGAVSGTNQVAELRAVLEAVVAHPGAEPLFIESDSLYAIKCASEWISGWRMNGWRTSSGGPVKNVELVRHIDQAISSRPGPVRFRWVRGHVGNYFNEQADQLAGTAARRAATAPDAAATGSSDLPALTMPDPTTTDPTEPIPIIEPAEPTEPIPAVTTRTKKVAAQAQPARAQTQPGLAQTQAARAQTRKVDALTLF